MRPSSALLLLALSACLPPAATDKSDTGEIDPDRDDDGYDRDADCDDRNASIHPGALERCDDDGVDEDCDGFVNADDDSVVGAIVVFQDADGDGYGADATAVRACDVGEGQSAWNGDCDDADASIHPSAQEVCDTDDTDEDCNGLVDDDDPGAAGADVTVFRDDDGDGYGDPRAEGAFCDVPAGWSDNDDDCDDDADFVYPGAPEVCDEVDDDCDGLADESDAIDATTFFADYDGDGYGAADRTRNACAAPDGFVSDDSDCDDLSPGVNPAAREFCDGEDDDCDGTTDESDAADALTWYRDADGDGYGTSATTTVSCAAVTGYASNDDDCNDTTASISPADTELCDSSDTDEDCDGVADDDDTSTSSTGKTRYYADADSDGYGSSTSYASYCDMPTGYLTTGTDCDDTSASISPAGAEVCDSANADEDCDGYRDDSDSSVSAATKSTYYRDVDGDGYGGSTTTTTRCDAPSGYSSYSTDCDDSNSARSPGRTEVCDGANLDEDCDSLADDLDSSTSSTGKVTYYTDADSDGYGLTSSATARCDSPGSGYITVAGDCNDGNSAISPGDPEVCFDSVDDDCDGLTACNLSTADAVASLTGESSSDYATSGMAIDNAGDVDGDGFDDLIVGAYGSNSGGTDAGRAYVYYSTAPGSRSLSTVDAILTGEDSYDYAGRSVTGIGDIDADGYDDVAIGAYGADDSYTSAGTVYIVRGKQTTIDLSTAWARLTGTATSEAAGYAVSGAGDVSGDGVPDLLVGAYGRSSSAGAVYLITSYASGTSSLSTATATLTGESSSDYAGASVDGCGDVNGDGYADICVGAQGDDDGGTDAGALYLILGPQSGTASLSTADAKRRGPSSSDAAGSVLAAAGDVNADGYDDVWVRTAYTSYYSVYLELGPFTGTASLSSADARIDGTSSAGTSFGTRIIGGGDVDGDGYADVAIAAPNSSEYATYGGTVYLFRGPLAGTTTSASAAGTIYGASTYDYLGQGGTFVGAQDGTSGESDLWLGALRSTSAGAAYLFSSF